MTKTTRIMIAGDSHCDYSYVKKLYEECYQQDVKHLIIAGDFGYWPKDNQGKDFLWKLNQLLTNKDFKLYFIDGNHEDFFELLKLPQNKVSELSQVNNCFYIPRGVTFRIEGVKIMGFGGAVSIDKKYRKVDVSWFHQETITDEQINDMIKRNDYNDIDLLITHDAPLNLLPMDYKKDIESDLHRQQIQRICNIVKPKMLVHGHFHSKWDYVYNGITCMGLEHNYNYNLNRAFKIFEFENKSSYNALESDTPVTDAYEKRHPNSDGFALARRLEKKLNIKRKKYDKYKKFFNDVEKCVKKSNMQGIIDRIRNLKKWKKEQK